MATEVYSRMQCDWLGELAKQDPPAPVPQLYHAPFDRSTHATLLAVSGEKSSSPCSALVKVSVLNASDNSMVHMDLDKGDTVGKLKERFLLQRPDLSRSLQFACNGKPVLDNQTLEVLNLKKSALFITYQKCVGG